jgi:serine phosphatase RsbU (regulator of sigma subunit)
MATLILKKGPTPGQEFVLDEEDAVVGRTPEVEISIASQAVSRRHAQVSFHDGAYVLKDLGSVNGTHVNGKRLSAPHILSDGDEVRVGDCVLAYRTGVAVPERTLTVDLKVKAAIDNLHQDQPGRKLQVLLELARHLGQALAMEELLDKLLLHLLDLFPAADRGLIVLCDGPRLVVRAQRSRRHGDADFRFSRSVIQQALAEEAGLLSTDVHTDQRFAESHSLETVRTSSVLCAPLIVQQGKKPLGVIQLDCTRPGSMFTSEQLHLLTTVGLLAGVVLENATLQEIRSREERLRRDLALAREIQLGFLPSDWTPPAGSEFEICARLHPARDVSGDLYDFFPLPDGRLVLLVGDVSDKGVPAALFMVKVQTLLRQLVELTDRPATILHKLNDPLCVNNPSSMFVTVALAIYDPGTGEVVIAAGGHPRPLLRRADGAVEEVAMPVGRLLGCFEGDPEARDHRVSLAHGETLIFYSDGYTEAAAPKTGTLFGIEAFKKLLGAVATNTPLADCAETARAGIERYIGGVDLQDDLTLLFLRRSPK